MPEPTIGQIFPRSGVGTDAGGGDIDEVAIQTGEPTAHPDLWVDTDESVGISGPLQEVVIQTSAPTTHNDLWIDTDESVGLYAGNARVLIQLSSNATLSSTAQTDFVYQCNAAPITLSLPTVIGNSALYTIKNIAASGTVTINAQSGQTIDGSSSYLLTTQYSKVSFISNGTNWIII